MKPILHVILVVCLFFQLFPFASKINAQSTCDEAGEECCGGAQSPSCGAKNLACNWEENPNEDPNLQYDDHIYICRNIEDSADLTTCDGPGENCCRTTGGGGMVIDTFCAGDLTCDASQNYTCQNPTNTNVDYSSCSVAGSSCCRESINGGLGGVIDYCSPSLTMIKTTTSCKCCLPGEDDCEPINEIIPFNMCNTIPDCKAGKTCDCSACLNNGGVWTALGCIHFNPGEFITDFLKIAIGIAGGIALLLMVYGSFLISTSAGDPKKAEEGKEIITGTIAGLLFIIFSVFLLNLIGIRILNIPGF